MIIETTIDSMKGSNSPSTNFSCSLLVSMHAKAVFDKKNTVIVKTGTSKCTYKTVLEYLLIKDVSTEESDFLLKRKEKINARQKDKGVHILSKWKRLYHHKRALVEGK